MADLIPSIVNGTLNVTEELLINGVAVPKATEVIRAKTNLRNYVDDGLLEITADDLVGITAIRNNAFDTCSNLRSIVIPTTITSIGSSAFYDCASLVSITLLSTTPPTLSSGALNQSLNVKIYVPSSAVSTYQSASGWSAYSDKIKAIP